MINFYINANDIKCQTKSANLGIYKKECLLYTL